MKKVFVVLLIIFLTSPFLLIAAEAQSPLEKATTQYQMLAPLGNLVGQNGVIDIANGGLSKYLNTLFRAGIILATGLAIIMITIGGLKYASTDAINGKSEGKEMIQQALLGLVLALMSVILLQQINPALLRSDIGLKPISTENSKIETIKVTLQSDGGDERSRTRYTTQSADSARNSNPDDPSYSLGNPDTQNPYDAGPVQGVMSKSGRATNFGYKDSEDNGMGAPILNPNPQYGDVRQSDGSYKKEPLGIITNDPNVRGVALPQSVLRSALGITGNSWAAYAPARKAGVLLKDGKGKQMIVPVVDFGPGAGPQSRGVVVDETYYVNQYFGGDGYREYTIIPNYYPNR